MGAELPPLPPLRLPPSSKAKPLVKKSRTKDKKVKPIEMPKTKPKVLKVKPTKSESKRKGYEEQEEREERISETEESEFDETVVIEDESDIDSDELLGLKSLRRSKDLRRKRKRKLLFRNEAKDKEVRPFKPTF